MHIGNSNISNLFIVIHQNKVLFIKSSLVDFVTEMKKHEPTIKNRNYFTNYFRDFNIYYYQNPKTGKQYTFEKIINTKE